MLPKSDVRSKNQRLTAEGKVIYIDPFAGEGYDAAADLILITHDHYDHNAPEKVENRTSDCRVITWEEALEGGVHQSFDLGYVTVESVEAGNNENHNIQACTGYILTLPDGITVYISGDTSKTEQMPLLAEKKTELRADERAYEALSEITGGEQGLSYPGKIVPACEEDWDTEFLDYILAVRTVDSVSEAMDFIREHGTMHSECIVTADAAAAEKFLSGVDAACVYVNASTRFTDGGEFGMGAEIGISTQKLHVRGPVGLPALTSTKYLVYGDGQIR